MKKYIIVEAKSLGDLERKVNHRINDGYQPTGGLAVIFGNTSTSLGGGSDTIMQAMLKEG